MQAGFALLEIGFSRGKSAGAGVAKILVNFSICAASSAGRSVSPSPSAAARAWSRSPAPTGSSSARCGHDQGTAFLDPMGRRAAVDDVCFFQFVFCAVSLAIVWGTTLERIKFSAYVDLRDHLQRADLPDHRPLDLRWRLGCRSASAMQDFAGSTVVHLIGATGGLRGAAAPRPAHRQVRRRRKPRAIPGHSMPLVGLGVLILWLGWFGFNPGSTLGASAAVRRGRPGHQPRRRRGRDRRGDHRHRIPKTHRHRHGRQRRDRRPRRDHGSVGLRRVWAAPIIGARRRSPRRRRRPRDREEASTTRSARSPRTASPVSGARSRAGSSPRRGSPTLNGSAIRASGTAARSTSSALRRSASCGVRVRVRGSPTRRSS